jgi:hypothetical protein
VFEKEADRGKSSMGWLYGFKVFLIVNHLGQIIKAGVKQASKADNNYDWLIFLYTNFCVSVNFLPIFHSL